MLELLHSVSVGHASVDACGSQVLEYLQDVIEHYLVFGEVIHACNDMGVSRLQISHGLREKSFSKLRTNTCHVF